MAHDLATINGKVAMAFTGETPWHRLGTHEQTGFLSVEAAMQAASLDWNISLEPMFYLSGDRYVKTATRRAVIRDVDGALLSTVGAGYEPVQNHEAFAVLNDAVAEFGVKIETAGALGKGDRVWMLAKMTESVEAVPGDRVDGYFLVTTGHNGWTSYNARLTPVRVVCQNTLSMAMKSGNTLINLNHTVSQVARLEEARRIVTGLAAGLRSNGEIFQQLAHTTLTRAQVEAYVNEVLGIDPAAELSPVLEKRQAKVIELTWSGKGQEMANDGLAADHASLWAAYNAVTEYVDHVRAQESDKPRMLQQANESAIFGTGARLKQKAFVVARRLARVA